MEGERPFAGLLHLVEGLSGLLPKRDESGGTVKTGVSAPILRDRLLQITGGWPKRLGDRLFAVSPEYQLIQLKNPPRLFAWMQTQFPVDWRGGQGFLSRQELESITLAYRAPRAGWSPRYVFQNG